MAVSHFFFAVSLSTYTSIWTPTHRQQTRATPHAPRGGAHAEGGLTHEGARGNFAARSLRAIKQPRFSGATPAGCLQETILT